MKCGGCDGLALYRGGGGGGYTTLSCFMLQKPGVTLNSGHVSSLWPVCDFTYPYKVVLQCTHVPFGQSVAEMCKGELECAMNSLSKQTALLLIILGL